MFAVLLGLPASLLFQKVGFRRWWQFALGGVAFAVPYWYSLAEPFSSPRWAEVGFFDSLNYLGSGLAGGIAFWWLSVRRSNENAA